MLAPEIEKLSKARVLCVGDVMLDRYVYGGVQRISPEAPVPVVKIVRSKAIPGGAGNVARNMAVLGARCFLLTVTGRDMAGDELRVLLQALPSLTCSAVIDQTRPTTVKTRFIASSQHVLRVDQEVDTPLPADVAQQLVHQATKLLREADVVVLSDYAKGVLTPQVTSAVIAAARASQVPVIVDPKGRDLSQVRWRIASNPKRKRAARGHRCDARTDEAVERATNALFSHAKTPPFRPLTPQEDAEIVQVINDSGA